MHSPQDTVCSQTHTCAQDAAAPSLTPSCLPLWAARSQAAATAHVQRLAQLGALVVTEFLELYVLWEGELRSRHWPGVRD